MEQELAGHIKVFGSSTIRVVPDQAVIDLGIRCEHADPSGAFAAAHAASTQVVRFLTAFGITNVQSSRINLRQAVVDPREAPKTYIYVARIGHAATLADLDDLEALLVGVIEAGANELSSVRFVSSRLKEHRQQARRKAVEAALEKAQIYAGAAGVEIAGVGAIEDVNPDNTAGRHAEARALRAHETDPTTAGTIEVAGRVHVWYRIA